MSQQQLAHDVGNSCRIDRASKLARFRRCRGSEIVWPHAPRCRSTLRARLWYAPTETLLTPSGQKPNREVLRSRETAVTQLAEVVGTPCHNRAVCFSRDHVIVPRPKLICAQDTSERTGSGLSETLHLRAHHPWQIPTPRLCHQIFSPRNEAALRRSLQWNSSPQVEQAKLIRGVIVGNLPRSAPPPIPIRFRRISAPMCAHLPTRFAEPQLRHLPALPTSDLQCFHRQPSSIVISRRPQRTVSFTHQAVIASIAISTTLLISEMVTGVNRGSSIAVSTEEVAAPRLNCRSPKAPSRSCLWRLLQSHSRG